MSKDDITLSTPYGAFKMDLRFIGMSRLLMDVMSCTKNDVLQLNNPPVSIKMVPVLSQIINKEHDDALSLKEEYELLLLCDYLDVTEMQSVFAKRVARSLNRLSCEDLKLFVEELL